MNLQIFAALDYAEKRFGERRVFFVLLGILIILISLIIITAI